MAHVRSPISLGHTAQFLPQRGIYYPGFLSHVLDDSVQRRPIRSAASCHVDGRPRHHLLYELVLVFLLFQDLDSARTTMILLDPSLDMPLQEKSYADDCIDGKQHLGQPLCHFLIDALFFFGIRIIVHVCGPVLVSL